MVNSGQEKVYKKIPDLQSKSLQEVSHDFF